MMKISLINKVIWLKISKGKNIDSLQLKQSPSQTHLEITHL